MIASPIPPPTPTAAATPASIADILEARGAGNRVFVVVSEAVWSIDTTGKATRAFEPPRDSEILALAAAPSAEEFAVLLSDGDAASAKTELLVFDADGRNHGRITQFGPPRATPVPNAGAFFESLDWSPQGDRILLSSRNGTIVDLPLAAGTEPSVFSVARDGEAIRQPTWSPTGERIAFLASTANEEQTLSVLNVMDGSTSTVVSPLDGKVVVDFVWMPDGVSLLFTEGGQPGTATVGIDLWRVDSDGDNRSLVASAGTVAPVARIVNARPSPDGRRVAYGVLVPSDAGPVVESLWVRDLASQVGFRVDLPDVTSVEKIWWTDRGIVVWATTTAANAEHVDGRLLLLVDSEGTVSELWSAPSPKPATPPAATPVSD